MKILVFSDSHKVIFNMTLAVKQHTPQMVIHLGDCVTDVMQLQNEFPQIIFHFVSGNNDVDFSVPSTKIIEVENNKIFLTHGHQYHVKSGLNDLLHVAKNLDARLLLFGHTHLPYHGVEYGMIVLNPGSCGKSYSGKATYGIIEMKEGKINATIEKI